MSNYAKAERHAHDAEMWGPVEDAQIAALNAQTFATLALVDEMRLDREDAADQHNEFMKEVRAESQDIRDMVVEEPSPALVDGTFRRVKPGSSVLTRYFLVSHGDDAVKKILRDLQIVRASGFITFEAAESHRQSLIYPNDYEVFRMTVEVVQP